MRKNTEKIKIILWRRLYLILLIAPTCLMITSQGQDARSLIWCVVTVISGAILLYSSLGSFVRRDVTQYSYFLMFSVLTGTLIYMASPAREFDYIWLIASPFAIITAFLSSLFINPKRAEKLIPEDWLEKIRT